MATAERKRAVLARRLLVRRNSVRSNLFPRLIFLWGSIVSKIMGYKTFSFAVRNEEILSKWEERKETDLALKPRPYGKDKDPVTRLDEFLRPPFPKDGDWFRRLIRMLAGGYLRPKLTVRSWKTDGVAGGRCKSIKIGRFYLLDLAITSTARKFPRTNCVRSLAHLAHQTCQPKQDEFRLFSGAVEP